MPMPSKLAALWGMARPLLLVWLLVLALLAPSAERRVRNTKANPPLLLLPLPLPVKDGAGDKAGGVGRVGMSIGIGAGAVVGQREMM